MLLHIYGALYAHNATTLFYTGHIAIVIGIKVMVMNSVSKCMACFEFHIFIAGSSGKVKHQNGQTEAVEIKDQHVQAQAIPKETSMLQQL